MRPILALLVLTLVPHAGGAQATSVEEPHPPTFFETFTRLFGIQKAIGDLRTLQLSDSAIEFRFLSVGWGISGLRLARDASGEWAAQRMDLEVGRAPKIDSMRVPTRTLDSLWNALVAEGLLTLPTHVPRTWGQLDGHSYMFELRRGQSYRAVHIEHVDKPEVPADDAIKRIVGILRRQFPFIGVPAR